MRRLARAIATVGGIGYLPIAPGTAGSVIGLLIGLFWPLQGSVALRVAILGAGFLVAVWASTVAERELKAHDPACVVIDEVLGMWVVVWLTPVLPLVVAFVLFRLFDITKPPPLKILSRFPGGWGIVLDDLGASVYTCLLLWLIRLQCCGIMKGSDAHLYCG